MIPLLPSLSSSVHVHSAPPNILPSSSMGQIGQPTLLPYAGSMEPPIPSIFHSAAALTAPNVTNLVTIKLILLKIISLGVLNSPPCYFLMNWLAS
ncbi:hypothetical protein KY289_001318 [Solanum tuberosum]|nr:hypothetical protein KY289_001318 [Solanum tuberosum]